MTEKRKELRWFENLRSGEESEETELISNGGKPSVNLEKHVAETQKWLNDIADLMGARNRPDWAYHALRGVLQALRDRMTPQEVFQLSAQLPLLIRGIYFEGYQPADKPEKIHKEELLNRIEKEMGPACDIQAKVAFMAVLKVLYDHVTEGELNDIYATMPKDIKEFWDRSLKSLTSYS